MIVSLFIAVTSAGAQPAPGIAVNTTKQLPARSGEVPRTGAHHSLSTWDHHFQASMRVDGVNITSNWELDQDGSRADSLSHLRQSPHSEMAVTGDSARSYDADRDDPRELSADTPIPVRPPTATVRPWRDGLGSRLTANGDPESVEHSAGDHAELPRQHTASTMPTAGTPQLSGQEWISVPTGGLTKEFEVELYGSTRTVSPGGLVLIRYSINSYEDQDERIRLRLYTPTGWILMDPEVEEREFLLEAWEFVEGEVRLLVPQDARPGERHKVYVLGEVVGEPGRAEVYASVQVVRRGGLRPGAAGLSGTASILATNFAMNDLRGARYGGVVDLSGKLTRDATLSLNYRQGPRENNLTNYRIAQDETRWSGTLRHPAWTLQFGNQVTSSGGVLTGPSVRGRGVIVRRVEGRLIGDLVVAEPTSFLGEAAGHVVRGSVGLSGSLGRVGVAFSDFARPAGGYSTAPRYAETIDPEEIDRLERERQALERSSRNRVQGAGLDAEIRPTKVHRVNLRGGWLQLTNAAGDTVSGPSAEAQYALHHRQGHLNVRWRRMPNSLQGIYLPGNEMAADASVRVLGEWRLAGRVYRSVQETRGNEYRSEGEGASFGVRYAAPTWRMEVSGNHRSWSYGNQPTEARTASMYFGVPLGPLHLGAHAERGYQSRENARQPSRSYRTDLRWINGGGSTASWSASYYEAFGTSPRFRTDVLGSLRLNEWEVSGGAWATRGLTFGGEPGVWSQIGIPIAYDLLFTLGVEYAPPTWGQSPTWMGTVGVRKKLAVPIPFLRDPSTPVLPGTGS